MLKVLVAGPPDYVDRIKNSLGRYSNISIPYTAQAPSHVVEILERNGSFNCMLLGFSDEENREILPVVMRYRVNVVPFVSVSDLLDGYTTWTPYKARPVLEGTEAEALYNFAPSIRDSEADPVTEYIPQETDLRARVVQQKTRKDVVVMPSKVISFFDFKGGVGKTTLVVALAKSVSALTGERVCICDLDISRDYGDVVKYLGIDDHQVKHTMVSWQHFPYHQKADWEVVKTHLLEARDNLYVIPGIGEMANTRELNPELLTKVLDVLKKHFTLVIFDLGNSINNLVVAAIEASDDVFLVNKPSEPEMKSLISFVGSTLPHIHIKKSQISLIYSLVVPGMKIGARDIVNSPLGISCVAEIPRDNSVELNICNNSYVPYLPKDVNPFTRELEKILYKVFPREAFHVPKTKFWRRFFRPRVAQ